MKPRNLDITFCQNDSCKMHTQCERWIGHYEWNDETVAVMQGGPCEVRSYELFLRKDK